MQVEIRATMWSRRDVSGASRRADPGNAAAKEGSGGGGEHQACHIVIFDFSKPGNNQTPMASGNLADATLEDIHCAKNNTLSLFLQG